MAGSTANTVFWSENLQESIQIASQQSKSLLCFVTDDSQTSRTWDKLITGSEFSESLQQYTIRLRLRKDSQEFGFLYGVCPIQSCPAVVLIKNGQIEEKLESPETSMDRLKECLAARCVPVGNQTSPGESSTRPNMDIVEQYIELPPSAGRMRLPNNAYDALRERSETLRQRNISAKNIFQLQLRLLDNIPSLKAQVQAIKSRDRGTAPSLSEESINRLLNTPATMLQVRPSSPTSNSRPTPSTPDTTITPASSTAPSPPPEPATAAATVAPSSNATNFPHPKARARSSSPPNASTPAGQPSRADFLRQQREREAAQRAERERIKAQIKSDREERRRIDLIRKQSSEAVPRERSITPPLPTQKLNSTDIRIQVRTFDGSTLRTSFPRTATITNDVRPWVDQANQDANKSPYNLKVILTPLPNRNIEASEESQALPDLAIIGSATLVMVPVRTFVESYSEPSTGVMPSIVRAFTGVGGGVVSGVLGMLGWGAPSTSTSASQTARTGTSPDEGSSASGSQMKVRTLADQRAEDSKKRGNQLYNGNSLDFQGKKDDEERKRD